MKSEYFVGSTHSAATLPLDPLCRWCRRNGLNRRWALQAHVVGWEIAEVLNFLPVSHRASASTYPASSGLLQVLRAKSCGGSRRFPVLGPFSAAGLYPFAWSEFFACNLLDDFLPKFAQPNPTHRNSGSFSIKPKMLRLAGSESKPNSKSGRG
jgi:hypothetical protein